MGNQSNKDPNSWEVVAKNDLSTIKRNNRGQHIEEYKQALQTQTDLKLFVERCQTRKYNFTDKPQLNVVELLDFKYNQLKLMCSMSYEGVCVIERIPTRLNQLSSLPEQKMIYVLSEVLNGYQSLSSFYGNEFDVQSKMIGLNEHNTVKVWHNSNLSKLDPEFQLLGSAYAKVNHENRMVTKIFQICQSLTEKQQFSPNFKFKRDSSLKRPYTFEAAKNFLTQYGEEFYPSLMQDFEPDRKLVKENVLQNGQVVLKEHKLNQPAIKKSAPPTLNSIPSKYQRFLRSESTRTLPVTLDKPPQHNLSLNYCSPIQFQQENNNHQQSVLSLKSYNMHSSFRPADSPQGPPKRTERLQQFQRPIVSQPQIFSKERQGNIILVDQIPYVSKERELPNHPPMSQGLSYNTAVSPSSQTPLFPQLPIRSSQNFQIKPTISQGLIAQSKPVWQPAYQARTFHPVVSSTQAPSDLPITPIYQLPQFNQPTPKTSPFPLGFFDAPSVTKVELVPSNPSPSMSPSPAFARRAPETHMEKHVQNKISGETAKRDQPSTQPIQTVKAMTLPTIRINPIKSDLRPQGQQTKSENQRPTDTAHPRYQQPLQLMIPLQQTQNRADSQIMQSNQAKAIAQTQVRSALQVKSLQNSQKLNQGKSLNTVTPLNTHNQIEYPFQPIRPGAKDSLRSVIMDQFVPRDVFRIDLNAAK